MKGLAWLMPVLIGCGLAGCSDQGDLSDGSCRWAADCSAGQRCHLGDCVECVEDSHCADGERCTWGTCMAQEVSPRPLPMVCLPGHKSCAGSTVEQCSDDGTAWTVLETCAASQTCSLGECHDLVCAPDRPYCGEGGTRRCAIDGLSGSLLQECGANQFCVEHDGAADCQETTCKPGAATCSADAATQCKSDGSGPEPGGQRCSEDDLLCFEGACLPRVCTPGEKLCSGGDLHFCTNRGTDSTLLEDCDDDAVCDPASLSCVKRCQPGARACHAYKILACNVTGTGFDDTGADCSLDGRLCVEGACSSLYCVPDALFCKANEVYRCAADGSSATLHDSCISDAERCQGIDEYQAYCISTCDVTEKFCVGNKPMTCPFRPELIETTPDCGDLKCHGGECKSPLLCDADDDAFACHEGNVARCNSDGTGYDSTRSCYLTFGEQCLGWGNEVACGPTPCVPGQAACLENHLGTCAANGLALQDVSTDCSSSNEVCDTATTCSTTAIDSSVFDLPPGSGATYSAPDSVDGNVVQVSSSRTLRKVEVDVSLLKPGEFRFVVYEWLQDHFELRLSRLVQVQAGTGYRSSGAVDYPLVAGKRYLLGFGALDQIAQFNVTNGERRISLGFVNHFGAVPFAEQLSHAVYGDRVGEWVAPLRLTTSAP